VGDGCDHEFCVAGVEAGEVAVEIDGKPAAETCGDA